MGPKTTPKSTKNSSKVAPEAFPEKVWKKCRKSADFGGPRTLKIEPSRKRELNFHFRTDTRKMYRKGPQKAPKMESKSVQKRLKAITEGV